ncbi:hypothetical protein [Streptomyces mayteni]
MAPITRANHAVAANPRNVRHVSRRVITASPKEQMLLNVLFELFEEVNAAGKPNARVLRVGTLGTAVETEQIYHSSAVDHILDLVEIRVEPTRVPGSDESKTDWADWQLSAFSPITADEKTTLSTSTSIGASLGFFGDTPTGGISYSYTTGKSWTVSDYEVLARPRFDGDIGTVAEWRFKRTQKDSKPAIARSSFAPYVEAVFSLKADAARRRYSAIEVFLGAEFVNADGKQTSQEDGQRGLSFFYVIDWETGEVYAREHNDNTEYPLFAADTYGEFTYRPPSPVGVVVLPSPGKAAGVRVPDSVVGAYAGGYDLTCLDGTPVDSAWNTQRRHVEFVPREDSPGLGAVVYISPRGHTGGFITQHAKSETHSVGTFHMARDLGLPEIPDAVWLPKSLDGMQRGIWADRNYGLVNSINNKKLLDRGVLPVSCAGITAGAFFDRHVARGVAVIRNTLQVVDLSTGIVTLGKTDWRVKLPNGTVKDLLAAVQTVLGMPLPAAIVGIDSALLQKVKEEKKTEEDQEEDDSAACLFFISDSRIAAVNLTATIDNKTPTLQSTTWVKLAGGAAWPDMTADSTNDHALKACFDAWPKGIPYLATGCCFKDPETSYWFHPAYAVDS